MSRPLCLYAGGCIAQAADGSPYCAVHRDPIMRAREWEMAPARPFGRPSLMRMEIERDADGSPSRLTIGMRRR